MTEFPQCPHEVVPATCGPCDCCSACRAAMRFYELDDTQEFEAVTDDDA